MPPYSFLILMIVMMPMSGFESAASYNQPTQRHTVFGRVVNQSGEPFPDVEIKLFSVRSEGLWHESYHSSGIGLDGRFSVELDAMNLNVEYVLYVLAGVRGKGASPLYRSFWEVKRLSDAGMRFRLEEGGYTFVGDIAVSVWFGHVSIEVKGSKGSGEPLGALVRVLDDLGDVVAELSERFVEDQRILMLLPVGVWSFELSPDWDQAVWYSSRQAAHVRDLTSVSRIEIDLAGGTDWTSVPAGPVDALKAKTSLHQEGLPFTPEAFLDRVRKGNRRVARLYLVAGMSADTSDENVEKRRRVRRERVSTETAAGTDRWLQ